jgi:hypothetical protein
VVVAVRAQVCLAQYKEVVAVAEQAAELVALRLFLMVVLLLEEQVAE